MATCTDVTTFLSLDSSFHLINFCQNTTPESNCHAPGGTFVDYTSDVFDVIARDNIIRTPSRTVACHVQPRGTICDLLQWPHVHTLIAGDIVSSRVIDTADQLCRQ